MKIKSLISYLENKIPITTQESYDNCGVQVGDTNQILTGTLVSLDCTEEVIQDAIDKKCNLIISHHPIIFTGIKSLTGKNYVERTVLKAIKNNIVLYAIHTNLDNYMYGVNYKIAEKLEIKKPKILSPKSECLKKIIVFVPKSHLEIVKNTLFKAGAGNIGNYSECSFQSEGIGTFKPLTKSNPFLGIQGKQSAEEEIKLEVVISKQMEGKVIQSMIDSHPYEEVAYDLIPLNNKNDFLGSGMYGDLEKEINAIDFLNNLKEKFKCGVIKYTKIHKEKIKRIAFCGGSGSFLLSQAKNIEADIFITGDFKYHEFFDAENQIIIADIGHFESEQYTIDLLIDEIKNIFPKFAIYFTGVNTNPINYL